MKKFIRIASVLALSGAALMFAGCTKDYSEDIDALENRVASLESANLASKVSSLESLVSSLQSAKAAASDVDALKTKVSGFDSSIAELKALIAKYQTLDAASSDKEALEKAVADLDAELTAEITKVSTELGELKTTVENLKTTLTAKDTELEGKLNKVSSEVDAAQVSIATLQSYVAALQARITSVVYSPATENSVVKVKYGKDSVNIFSATFVVRPASAASQISTENTKIFVKTATNRGPNEAVVADSSYKISAVIPSGNNDGIVTVYAPVKVLPLVNVGPQGPAISEAEAWFALDVTATGTDNNPYYIMSEFCQQSKFNCGTLDLADGDSYCYTNSEGRPVYFGKTESVIYNNTSKSVNLFEEIAGVGVKVGGSVAMSFSEVSDILGLDIKPFESKYDIDSTDSHHQTAEQFAKYFKFDNGMISVAPNAGAGVGLQGVVYKYFDGVYITKADAEKTDTVAFADDFAYYENALHIAADTVKYNYEGAQAAWSYKTPTVTSFSFSINTTKEIAAFFGNCYKWADTGYVWGTNARWNTTSTETSFTIEYGVAETDTTYNSKFRFGYDEGAAMYNSVNPDSVLYTFDVKYTVKARPADVVTTIPEFTKSLYIGQAATAKLAVDSAFVDALSAKGYLPDSNAYKAGLGAYADYNSVEHFVIADSIKYNAVANGTKPFTGLASKYNNAYIPSNVASANGLEYYGKYYFKDSASVWGIKHTFYTTWNITVPEGTTFVADTNWVKVSADTNAVKTYIQNVKGEYVSGKWQLQKANLDNVLKMSAKQSEDAVAGLKLEAANSNSVTTISDATLKKNSANIAWSPSEISWTGSLTDTIAFTVNSGNNQLDSATVIFKGECPFTISKRDTTVTRVAGDTTWVNIWSLFDVKYVDESGATTSMLTPRTTAFNGQYGSRFHITDANNPFTAFQPVFSTKVSEYGIKLYSGDGTSTAAGDYSNGFLGFPSSNNELVGTYTVPVTVKFDWAYGTESFTVNVTFVK